MSFVVPGAREGMAGPSIPSPGDTPPPPSPRPVLWPVSFLVSVLARFTTGYGL